MVALFTLLLKNGWQWVKTGRNLNLGVSRNRFCDFLADPDSLSFSRFGLSEQIETAKRQILIQNTDNLPRQARDRRKKMSSNAQNTPTTLLWTDDLLEHLRVPVGLRPQLPLGRPVGKGRLRTTHVQRHLLLRFVN